MPIGWVGLNMPTNACSVHMLIGRVNFKVGVLSKTLSHIWLRLYLPIFLLSMGLLTLMQIDSFIVLARPWSFLPPYDAEVIRCAIISSLGIVHMNGRGFLQVLLEPFPLGPGYFPYVVLTINISTLVQVNSSSLLVYGVLVL